MIFSFVIPCFNEANHLTACIDSIRRQRFTNGQYEIIVADNGSTDGSDKIAKEKADKYLSCPDIKVGEVRNRGSHLASGQWLIFLDADCVLDQEWLSRLYQLIEKHGKSVVFGGGCSLPKDRSWVEQHWLLEGPDGNTLPRALIGCSIAIEKQIFKTSGGFNDSLSAGEDSEFSNRLKERGKHLLITRDLNVIHLGNAKTLAEFYRRQVWHGQSYRTKPWSHIGDPVYLLTLSFVLLPGFALFTLLARNPTLSSLCLGLWVALPSILTTKRYFRARKKPKLKELSLAYILDFTYLAGRSRALCPDKKN